MPYWAMGARLAATYGLGCQHQSTEVVNEMQATHKSPLGRSTLLKFLEQWALHNPIA